jgi:glycosyltransferase involved in cell wall biosynthesis
MPELSVIMSVYNGGSDLRGSIESVLAQTLTNFEFIIINDGSTDGTADLLGAYAKRDVRIKVYTQGNKGLTNSLNFGISRASAHLIARQDADDISMPVRFEKEAAYLSENPQVGLVGTGFVEKLEQFNNSIDHLFTYRPEQCRQHLIKGNFMCHSSIMFRKEVFLKAGGYNINYHYTEDYKLYFDILKISEIGVIPEILVYKNTKNSSLSVLHSREQRTFATKAKSRAIRDGQYDIFKYYYVIKTMAGNFLPGPVRSIIDYMRFGQGKKSNPGKCKSK